MITAKKSLGQNFLVNQGIVQKIVDAADVKAGDVILEIGPGTGILTKELVSRAGKVIAIEKDGRLIDELKSKFPSIEVVEEDILKFDPTKYKILDTKYKVVGNIPYYITSHLLRVIFEQWSRSPSDRGSSTKSGPSPETIVLMVQKEVAQRIMAKPPHMNILALSVQFYAKPEIISYVSRGSFRPEPNVDSAVVKLTPKKSQLNQGEIKHLFKIIRAGFSSKRKKLSGNLQSILNKDKEQIETLFEALGLKPTVRAEELALTDWVRLAKNSQ